MIWSPRKQYYLDFWNLNRWFFWFYLTGLYFHHGVDIISTCYVYENRRKLFLSLNFIFWFLILGGEGGTNICQQFSWVNFCLQKHTLTRLKCLNANFIFYATQLSGSFRIRFFFFFDNLHLQIMACISPQNICREFISPVGYILNYTVQALSRRGNNYWWLMIFRSCQNLLVSTFSEQTCSEA